MFKIRFTFIPPQCDFYSNIDKTTKLAYLLTHSANKKSKRERYLLYVYCIHIITGSFKINLDRRITIVCVTHSA